MNRKTIIKQGRQVVLTACGLLVGVGGLQSCKDEVLTGQPEWLGNSIYERLQEEGNYTTLLHLVDDLDLKEVLGHTGSRTLFATDDQAYDQWFQHNSWGVSSYNQLTTAQKKLLLNNSMINNAYLIELMSNVSGNPPEEGKAMRRETAATIYDSVYIMPAAKMPATAAWAKFKDRGKSIPIFKDGTSATMIHFLPAFMRYNKITAEDLRILTNGQANSTDEAWVNGKRVVERDITCKNGYIQKVDGVIESNPNMAEIIRTHPKMSMWSHLIDRYSAPYYHAEGTREYNRLYNSEDSVFTLRYFSRRSLGGEENSRTPDGDPVVALLAFDPGWNHYMYSNTMNYDLHYDAAAMIVPTNEALQQWWDTEGRDLQDEYRTWDSIPDATLARLINVNMLDVFTSSVPSKFNTVLNDAKEPLGITAEDVDSCFMGCNGVVYMVNRVFSPAEFASVVYPATAHQTTMSIIYWGIDKRNFLPYLLSMDSKYAMMLPTNEAMLSYIDPGSYGRTTNTLLEDSVTEVAVESPYLIEFSFNPRQPDAQRVQATRYECTVDADGNITKGNPVGSGTVSSRDIINTMLDDLIDQLIIVVPDKSLTLDDYIDQGYQYFKTKGGTLIRVTKGADGALVFEGGWQMEHNHKPLPSTSVYPKSNGISYQLENQMPLGSQRSLSMILKEHQEYRTFLNMLDNDNVGLFVTKLNNTYNAGNAAQNNKNFRLFDNYNYTVYVPTNESIQKLQDDGTLPTIELLDLLADPDVNEHVLDSLCEAERWFPINATEADKDQIRETVNSAIANVVVSFIRYHVQDHSVAIGMAPESGMSENSFESMKRNQETGRFYPLEVSYSPTELTVTDVMGNTRHVVKTEGLYNNICREYWFRGEGTTAQLFMASDAVVHLIDQPLFYEQPKSWRQAVREALSE